MYAQPQRLGEFVVPDIEDWVLSIQYIPRPPLAVRGALNPWELERTRVLWTAEETAWKVIQILQAQYRNTRSLMRAQIVKYNAIASDIDALVRDLTGKPSGIKQISTYGSYIGVIPAFFWLGAIFKVIGFVSDLFGASAKKKKMARLNNLVVELNRTGEQIKAYERELVKIQKATAYQTQITQRTRSEQAELVTQAIQLNQERAAQRVEKEQAMASARRTLYAQARQTARNGVPSTLIPEDL